MVTGLHENFLYSCQFILSNSTKFYVSSCRKKVTKTITNSKVKNNSNIHLTQIYLVFVQTQV